MLLTLLGLLMVPVTSGPSSAEEFLLYSPKAGAGDDVPSSPDQGVLVKKVTVKRGDTLAKLSRKHIGVAKWFPQILVFNSIANPDLIHIGDQLLIPVRPRRAGSVKKSARGKRPHARQSQSQSQSPRLAPSAERPVSEEKRPVPSDEQKSYRRAKQAYLDGKYQKALDLFTAFLRKNPDSQLAADASLYRAESLLRLSGADASTSAPASNRRKSR